MALDDNARFCAQSSVTAARCTPSPSSADFFAAPCFCFFWNRLRPGSLMGAMEAMRSRTKAGTVAPIWSALDEAELIRRARTERGAFGELYRRHYDAIGSYLLRRTGCPHTTEDLLSEVFLSAMSAMPSFRDRGIPYRHYLYRIATRASNRWLKRLRRAPRPLDSSALVDPRGDGNDASDTERILRALQTLPPKHQEVVALHYVEGIAVDEVARILRTRPGTVKSRLKRARDTLRVRLGSPS